MGVLYIGDREGRGGVFRRLCVGMILGWDFYWFGVGRGCDVFLWGGRVLTVRSWGRDSDRVGHSHHNIPSPGVLMKGIGAEVFLRPDALPGVNYMRGMQYPKKGF